MEPEMQVGPRTELEKEHTVSRQNNKTDMRFYFILYCNVHKVCRSKYRTFRE